MVVVEEVMKKGRGRLLDYLMEFLASSCYIERKGGEGVNQKVWYMVSLGDGRVVDN